MWSRSSTPFFCAHRRVDVTGEIKRGTHHLCACAEFDDLMPWHTSKHREIAPSPTGGKKPNVYIVNYDYYPSKIRVGLFVRTWSFWQGWGTECWKLKWEERWEYLIRKDNTNMIKPSGAEYTAVCKQITYRDTQKCTPREGCFAGILRGLSELDRKRAVMKIYQRNWKIVVFGWDGAISMTQKSRCSIVNTRQLHSKWKTWRLLNKGCGRVFSFAVLHTLISVWVLCLCFLWKFIDDDKVWLHARGSNKRLQQLEPSTWNLQLGI